MENKEKLELKMNRFLIFGSFCFILSSTLYLFRFHNSSRLNHIFFIGSVFFTLAGYLQIVIAGKGKNEFSSLHQWLNKNRDYKAAFTQWIGMLFFNINTFDACLQDLNILQQNHENT